MSLIHRTRGWALALIAITAGAALGPAVSQAEDDAVQKATQKDGLYAVFETSMGPVVCELFYDKVPITVANFIGLATGEQEWTDPKTGEKVMRPFYDGLKFHRIIKDFMIQGGCPLGNGRGGPGYSFTDEFHPDLRHTGPGVLSMANSGPNTNGSQFFITHKATGWLDNKHSVFGQCVLGQDIVDGMASVEMKGPGPQPSIPVKDITLDKLTIVRTGEAATAFDWKENWSKRDELTKKIAEEREEAMKEQLANLCTKLGADLSTAVTSESGLRSIVTGEGDGASPAKGQTISAHYTGYLPDGQKFDSSHDRGKPFETEIGVGRVIRGWDEAFVDMKVGEKRLLIIPPDLGYGARGAGTIPPNSTLVFDVELVGIK
jgi:peptidylprolyl isomerase